MVDIYLGKKQLDEIAAKKANELPNDIHTLCAMEQEIANQIYHLKTTIEEILEMDPEGEDQDLKEAAVENLGAIRTKQEKLDQVREKMTEMGLCKCSHTHSQPTSLDEPKEKESNNQEAEGCVRHPEGTIPNVSDEINAIHAAQQQQQRLNSSNNNHNSNSLPSTTQMN